MSNTFATPWTVADKAPLAMGFPRQEWWGGVDISFSSGSHQPRDWPASLAFAGGFFTTKPPGKMKELIQKDMCSPVYMAALFTVVGYGGNLGVHQWIDG